MGEWHPSKNCRVQDHGELVDGSLRVLTQLELPKLRVINFCPGVEVGASDVALLAFLKVRAEGWRQPPGRGARAWCGRHFLACFLGGAPSGRARPEFDLYQKLGCVHALTCCRV